MSAHKLKEFLREKDPSNNWGGLTRVVLPEDATAEAATTSAAAAASGGKPKGPVLWCCTRCLQGGAEAHTAATAAGPPAAGDLQAQNAELRAQVARLQQQLARGQHEDDVGCFGRRTGSSSAKVHPS